MTQSWKKKTVAGQKHYSDSHVLIISCTNSDFLEDYTVSSTNIGTLGKYDQRRLWK